MLGGKKEVDVQDTNSLEIDELANFAVAEHLKSQVRGSGCLGYLGLRGLCWVLIANAVAGIFGDVFVVALLHIFVVLGRVSWGLNLLHCESLRRVFGWAYIWLQVDSSCSCSSHRGVWFL
uniref:Uncharacterized protein n=1 Tax=Physcomitrium patens TaxID=3218 RepID=A0A7I3Z7E1_PHYPA